MADNFRNQRNSGDHYRDNELTGRYDERSRARERYESFHPSPGDRRRYEGIEFGGDRDTRSYRGSDYDSSRMTGRDYYDREATYRDQTGGNSHRSYNEHGAYGRERGRGFSNNRMRQASSVQGSSTLRPDYSGRGPRGWQRSDERIRDDASERLSLHPDIDASEIEVNVKDGIITLSGHVDSRRVKRMAEDAVEDVSGAKDVRNELSIDESLFQKAKHALMGESESKDTKH